ncbi:ABC transporter ATP-binding protein [Campylobacter sp. MIT 12-8780]|uniref:ribosomal protection-like ABC-F family protein n=1 Tax=Campylobacter sp. MIT 12-8780 TaxID=2202200 RepID=UPI00115CC702|nr:ABC-F family ATP-binding cassette domain-containing protein [Campylobacter sp. MIT 12-8780]TQR41862.1 ABC transporter ATP-binding protein [Campylobacter sp. MIT 12-8780]
MALLECIEANKKFGEKIILKAVNFSANKGEKIAIIGKNGCGKSSLLKALYGKLKLDSGRVIKQNDISVAMLAQELDFNSNLSVKEALKEHLAEEFKALKAYESLNERLASEPENKELLKQINSLFDFITSKDAWNLESKMNRALKELDLLRFEHRSLLSLSGGELRRIALCAILLKSPDIMLLDEPSNHLDVYMCAFLENYLKNSKSCVIFISHDRYFIDEVATRCVELEEGELRKFEGNYTYYLAKKAELLASLSKSYETLVKQLKSEEEWLRRGVKARLKRNEGRKERILKMREEAKKNPSQINKLKLELQRAQNNFTQTQSTNRQKMLFELENISKSMGEKLLFKDFSTRILQLERIGIVGKNGCGKSSLLKILLDRLSPDSGKIKRGELKIGYFDQARALLESEKTLQEIFCPNGGDRVEVRGKNMHIYGYLKQFLFPKEFLTQNVAVLSGGEKNRVALALLFTKEYDMLVLDEPTNDLDIATINILEEYLLSFNGAILLVSHDRYFMDKIASKLFVFKPNGSIEIEHKSYTQLLEDEKELKEFEELSQKLSSKEPDEAEYKSKNIKTNKSTKLSYKEQEILKSYPDKITQLETKIKELEHALSKQELYEEQGITSLYEELSTAQSELSSLEEVYFEVLEKSEN